ncbi:MAG: GDP-mannose 4,6-dehydratase [Candidatus Obscuribacterales bacterium]|nr:GDP-mannose 4,6-dehydratase [Candidatus Obscuribacterales bacterium]
MKILITGGAGCLGSNLIEHWLPDGHELFVIDNFVTGKPDLLSGLRGLSLCEGTIADAKLVKQCFADFRPEVVVHAAASYKDPDDWEEDNATNILGSINVARAALEFKSRRIINLQTALCFGRAQETPVSNDHPLAPFSSYGITKTAGEQFMLLSQVPLLSLRIANVTGPRLSIGPIPTFYKRLKAGQRCFCSDTARDFLDMSDFLSFMDLAIAASENKTGVFNIATGKAHTIKEVYELVARHLGLEPGEVRIVPAAADDVPVLALDPEQTEQVFGWKAAIDFEETISRQLSWYDEHGVSEVYSHLKKVESA